MKPSVEFDWHKLFFALDYMGVDAEVGIFDNLPRGDKASPHMRAIYAEFGTKTQVPRPFFSRAVASHKASGSWVRNFQVGMGRAMGRELTPEDLALIVGKHLKREVQKQITWMNIPNRPATIGLKGHSVPLIDTRLMYDSVKVRLAKNKG